MSWQMLVVPVSSALTAWLVVRLILFFLFRPQKPVRFAGVKIIGLLPGQQSDIAHQLGRLAQRELPATDIIGQKLTDPAQIERIMPVIESHIDDFLRNKLKKEMPMVGMLIGEKTIGSLKQIFMNELRNMFPTVIGTFATNMVNDLDIATIVTEKINKISLAEIETSFKMRYARQLVILQFLGAAFGFLIGGIVVMISYIMMG